MNTLLMSTQRGFTLIELMIVVAIVGILSATAIPQYQDYIQKAKLSKVQSFAAPIKGLASLYYGENGECPDSTDAAMMTALGRNKPTLLNPVREVTQLEMGIDSNDASNQTCLLTLTLPKLGVDIPAGSIIYFHGDHAGNPVRWTATSQNVAAAKAADIINKW